MSTSYASYDQLLPPTSPSHAVSCHLTKPTASSASYPTSRGVLLFHLVTARDETLQIWEIRVSGADSSKPKLWHLRTKSLSGSITGLRSTKTYESDVDGKDRLVVSFKDAKISLMEWDELNQDLTTISVHTYERASQMSAGLPDNFRPILSLDPAYRCATLLLPKDSLAVLPLTSASDLDLLDEDEGFAELYTTSTSGRADGSERKVLPYSPSFVLPLSEIDEGIRNIRNIAFLPNFQKPTAAILCESDAQSWTGSLSTQRDTVHLYLVTLDLSSTSHTVLSHVSNLPYDTLYAEPSPTLGGVFVVTTTAIFHVDQNGKLSGIRVNGWTDRITTNEAILAMPEWKCPSGSRPVDLSNSHLLWTEGHSLTALGEERTTSVTPASGSGLLLLDNGLILSFHCSLDGRAVSSIDLELLESETSLEGFRSSVAILTEPQHQTDHSISPLLFLGSMLGDSKLLALGGQELREASDEQSRSTANGHKEKMDLDYDDDEDLYGDSNLPSTTKIAAKGSTTASGRILYSLIELDTIPGLGPISDIALAVVRDTNEEDVVKTVAAHGVGSSSALTQFEWQLQPRRQQDLVYSEQQTTIWHVGDQTVVFDVGAGQESLVCRIEGENGQMSQLGSVFGGILAAGSLLVEGPVIAIVREAAVQLFDLTQLEEGPIQSLVAGGPISQAFIHSNTDGGAPHIALTTEDGGVHIYRYSRTNTLLQPVEFPRTSSDPAQMCFLFSDLCGATTLKSASEAGERPTATYAPSSSLVRATNPDDEVDYGDDDDDDMEPESAIESNQREQSPPTTGGESFRRLAILTKRGSLELYALPSFELLWRSNSLWDLPMSLDGLGSDEKVHVCSQSVDPSTQCVWVGSLAEKLIITVIGEDGLLSLWEAALVSTEGTEDMSTSEDLQLVFNKSFAKQLSAVSAGAFMAPDGEMPQKVRNHFANQRSEYGEGPALFVSGHQPGWVGKTRKSGYQFFASALEDISSFVWLSDRRYVVAHPGGISSAELPEDLNYDLAIPRSSFSTGRDYTHVRAYPSLRALIAASTVETPFALFDPEDGEIIRSLEVDPTPAMSRRGIIELFKDDWTEPIDGFELEQNETVSALELLTLTSSSTPTGLKEFIAVGTTCFNGEDRPTKGATYIFDIVETVPNPSDPLANVRLKLLIKEDARGPVTALSDISGYLVCAIGQKLYIRAFENHEVLIHVAFLDTNYLTTSIRRLGSTLLLSDLKKSLTFVGFQEDPFKLTIFSRDFNDSYATTGNYLISEHSLAFLSTDVSGSIRLMDYNPSIPSTQGGQRLILRTEFQCSTEITSSTTLSGPSNDSSGGLALSNQILLGGQNGSFTLVKPIPQETFGRLHSLQSTMYRNVQHLGGLNPRGFRIVKNETVSRPLNKGILDGALLRRFLQGIGRPKMEELISLARGNERDEEEEEDGQARAESKEQGAKGSGGGGGGGLLRILQDLRQVL